MIDIRAELARSLARRGIRPPDNPYEPEQAPYRLPKGDRVIRNDRGQRRAGECHKCGRRTSTTKPFGQLIECAFCRRNGCKCPCGASIEHRGHTAKYCETCGPPSRRKERRCLDCPRSLEGTPKNRKRCPECARAHELWQNRVRDRKYRERKRAERGQA